MKNARPHVALRDRRELEILREAGRVTAIVLRELAAMAMPGVKTKEIDRAAEARIRELGAEPLFKGYRGYPASICISINEQVVHGIPGERALREGDVVSLDLGVRCRNYCGDAAITVGVGAIDERARRLLDTTREALDRAVAQVREGGKLLDIARAIQPFVEGRKLSLVREYMGHGIGTELHEEPQVPNTVMQPVDRFERELRAGMVLAIEPMVNEGRPEVETLDDHWTVVTRDRKRSAHFEHTVAVTPEGPWILTDPSDEPGPKNSVRIA